MVRRGRVTCDKKMEKRLQGVGGHKRGKGMERKGDRSSKIKFCFENGNNENFIFVS